MSAGDPAPRDPPLQVAVESWAPGYGSAHRGDGELTPTAGDVDVSCEIVGDAWEPQRPGCPPSGTVVFVDGVRRVDARLWISDQRGTRPGLAVSLAAGLVCCDGAATVEGVRVARGVVGRAPMPELPVRGALYRPMHAAGEDPEALLAGAQERLSELEVAVAREAPAADLVVLDGPLPSHDTPPHAVGYVKSHHMAYLPDEQAGTVARLAAGERTPLFVVQTNRSRYSWYLRLPHGRGHPWAGVVRCEAPPDLGVTEAARLADASSATLPRFASRPHKEPRAPQNLYPIAGLERELRRMLGDGALLERALRRAVHGG